MSYAYKTSYTLDGESIYILPVGSIEQHDDLPLGTDTFIAECIAWKVRDKLEEQGVNTVVMPPIYYGFSPEWRHVRGTITLDPVTFCNTIKSIVEGLACSGASKIVILNGHGGNSGILKGCLQGLIGGLDRNDILIAHIDYYRYIKDARLGHACSVERSLLQYCGIDAPLKPINPVEKSFESWVYYSSLPREPVAIIPPGSKALSVETIEDMINSITSNIIGFISMGRQKAFP
ncbi:MAG: creatininase family protein [Desulfurococcales archaeon]|nr:creatininase family protein [Desulfurococcales archaeon]